MKMPCGFAVPQQSMSRCSGSAMLVVVLLAFAPPGAAQSCTFQAPPARGQGVAVLTDCTRREGTFLGGVMFGEGKITYGDGRVLQGKFAWNELLGEGIATWPDGRRYEGNFCRSRSMGRGTYTHADGTVDEGMFEPGAKLHGFGARRLPDGSVLIGEFRWGKPFGAVLLVKADGSREAVAFNLQGAPGGANAAAGPPAAVPAAPQSAEKPRDATQSITQPVEDLNNAIRGLRGIFGR
jgi:hypothetical protein